MSPGNILQSQHPLTSIRLGFLQLIRNTIIQVASRLSDAFDSLLDAYARIGESLPVFAAVDTLFSGHGEHYVQQILANVYEDVLKFHSRAVNFFRQRSMCQIFYLNCILTVV